MTALLAFGATYVGANLANNGALTTQREQIAEDRAATDRDRRAETYVDFLTKASVYAYAVDEASTCVSRETAERTDGGSTALSPECSASLAGVATPRSEFQQARNLVFYYGSQEAEDAAALLAGTLPSAVGKFEDLTFGTIDFDRYGQRYHEFNKVVCRDVQTDPDRRCG